MSEDEKRIEGENGSFMQRPGVRRALLIAGGVVVAFLIGLVPMWMTARERASTLSETQSRLSAVQGELRLARLENKLATAALDARRAEYESARRAASEFFTELRAEADKEQGSSALTEAQKGNLQAVFAPRDEIITLLARSDPASAEKLSDVYFRFRQSLR